MIQERFLLDHMLNLASLQALTQPPPLFEEGTVEFWRDPYIARQMLAVHLDPSVDAASRRPETIDRSVNWIVERLGLQAGDTLLDLGCGPGLYCRRFAGHGLRVTGVDFSENSINYARAHDPATVYVQQDYLTLNFESLFRAVTLIFGDFCVLSGDKRATLSGMVKRALQPGGYFVFDVSTRAHHERENAGANWWVTEADGFWSPRPHLTLERNFLYPDDDVALAQYIVVEADGGIKVYRNWFHYYSPETIAPELEQGGFVVEDVYGDLTGAPFEAESEWLGVVARKV